MAISKRWAAPEKQYKEWYKLKDQFALSEVQFVAVEADTLIANMIGQHNIRKDKDGNPPIRYEAVLDGLTTIGVFAIKNKAMVHMPRIGCGLAGGTCSTIEPLITAALLSRNVLVTVYDFQPTLSSAIS